MLLATSKISTLTWLHVGLTWPKVNKKGFTKSALQYWKLLPYNIFLFRIYVPQVKLYCKNRASCFWEKENKTASYVFCPIFSRLFSHILKYDQPRSSLSRRLVKALQASFHCVCQEIMGFFYLKKKNLKYILIAKTVFLKYVSLLLHQ